MRHYRGGIADWKDAGGPLETTTQPPPAPSRAPAPPPRRIDPLTMVVDLVGRSTIERLLQVWVLMIAVFGLLYWAAGAMSGEGLSAGGVPEGGGWRGLVDSIYFSFVTALSIGYGDVVPLGLVRVLAVLEGAAGLLIFGCVISKLVSRRQDELIEQTHRIAFEDRLGRVRTNLHLVLSEIQAISEQCADTEAPPDRLRTRAESAATVFAGELRAIHDLLYRPQQLPDETVLESILANVASGLREMNDMMVCAERLRRDSAMLRSTLREISTLAGEICGECVPRDYAPELKDWMDRIQEQSRRMV